MKNLECITSTAGETSFFISILETGWIYDVFLILTNELKTKYEEWEIKRIPAQYSDKEIIDGQTFSIFTASYKIDNPSDLMIAFFIYSIRGVEYVTDPMYFAVKEDS